MIGDVPCMNRRPLNVLCWLLSDLGFAWWWRFWPKKLRWNHKFLLPHGVAVAWLRITETELVRQTVQQNGILWLTLVVFQWLANAPLRYAALQIRSYYQIPEVGSIWSFRNWMEATIQHNSEWGPTDLVTGASHKRRWFLFSVSNILCLCRARYVTVYMYTNWITIRTSFIPPVCFCLSWSHLGSRPKRQVKYCYL